MTPPTLALVRRIGLTLRSPRVSRSVLVRHLRLLTWGATSLLPLAASWVAGCSDEPSASGPESPAPAGSQHEPGDDGGATTTSTGGGNGSGGAAEQAGASSTPAGGDSASPNETGGSSPASMGGAPSAEPDPEVGGAANEQDALCATFCDDEGVTCTGDLQQYADSANCLAECAGWSRGFVGDTAGNTLDCRISHLAAAAANEPDAAATHCPETGAHPAVYCKD